MSHEGQGTLQNLVVWSRFRRSAGFTIATKDGRLVGDTPEATLKAAAVFGM